MTVGLASASANSLMNTYRATSYSVSATYVKLHISDPLGSATSGAAAVTTRSQATFSAASGGAIALTGTNPTWSMTTTETITHISVWDASTAGNFLWSAALSASKSVANGDTLTLTTCGLSVGALAA